MPPLIEGKKPPFLPLSGKLYEDFETILDKTKGNQSIVGGFVLLPLFVDFLSLFNTEH